MAEFTGERVIPGQVDVDLLNEHMARYTFAARLARGKRVLDAGCGAGYGSAELARTARRVVGVDSRRTRSDYAREHYRRRHLDLRTGVVRMRCRIADGELRSGGGVRGDRASGGLARDFCAKRAACWRPAGSSWSPRPTSCTTRNRAGREGAESISRARIRIRGVPRRS